MDEELLALRFQATGSGKEVPLKSLTRRYLAYVHAEPDAATDAAEAYRALQREIALFEFSMQRQQAVIEANQRQVEEYAQLERSVEAEVQTTQAEIAQLAAQLEEERTKRMQREQYAALARRINQFPPRADTEAELAKLEREIDQLRAEGAAADAKLDERARLFNSLVHSLHDVQACLHDDSMQN